MKPIFIVYIDEEDEIELEHKDKNSRSNNQNERTLRAKYAKTSDAYEYPVQHHITINYYYRISLKLRKPKQKSHLKRKKLEKRLCCRMKGK